MDGLQPVFDMNGNNYGGWGGSALGAFGGALVGSFFGDGWRGGRGGYGYGDGVGACAGAAFGANAILDAVNGVQNSVNQANTANIQGFAGLNTTTLQSVGALQNSTNQGFAGLNTSILTTANDTQRAIDNCCCTTQRTIIDQGCQTRELINQQTLQATRDKLFETQSKLAQCETLNVVDAKINAATNQIIAHMKLICDAATAK